jgi:endogenous inhibitor of DNA gyrase (YacG/DUF329 family)
MIQGRCPICSRSYTLAAVGELVSFPFCSDRCRLIDLGRWLKSSYMINGSPADVPSNTEQGLPPDDGSS